MTGGTQLAEAAEWIVSLRAEHIPMQVMALARAQIIDTVAAICASSRSELGQRVRRAVDRIASAGPCTLLPGGERYSLSDTVYLHSALANALELDNFVLSGHFGQSAVAVSLALGEMRAATWAEVMTAQVAGLEVATRLGAYISAGPQHGQMRAYAHRLAAAASASRLLGLPREKTEKALAIALAAPEFPLPPAAFSPDTKVTMTSSPAVEGLRAAFLADAGLDAATDILDHPLGLVGFFTYMDCLPRVWQRLGRTWFLYSLSSKTHATCAYAQGPVTAALEVREAPEFSAELVEAVHVDAPLTTVVMEAFSRPHTGAGVTPVNTHFSTRRSVAAALLFGELTGEFFDSRFESRAPRIGALAERVVLAHDWSMTIELLRGIDAALEGAGKPGIYGMGQTQHMLRRFTQLVGSRGLLAWSDIPDLLRLDRANRSYFLRRYWRGYRSRLPFWGGREARLRYRSQEDDFSRITLRLAGRVRVRLRNGHTLTAECSIPPGFAGDPQREQRMRDKFRREAGAALGPVAKGMLAALERIPDGRVADLFEPLRRAGGPKWSTG